MFRVPRLFLPQRNAYNLPLLTQWSQPKQVVVDFSIITDNKEEPQQNRTFTYKKNIYAERRQPKEYLTGNVFQTLKVLKGRQDTLKDIVNRSGHSPSDIVKVLKMLAESNNRPVDILGNLCQIIERSAYSFSVSEISDILYSFARLSYRNQDCIEVITEVLKKDNAEITPKLVSSVLHSLGVLKYRDPQLLDILLNSLVNLPLDIKTSLECLMSLGFLNYPCSYAETLAKFLSELSDMEFYRRNDYFNFVWSCVMLNQMQYISQTHLPKVVSDSYLIQTIPDYHPGIKLKLLNIQAAAELFMDKPVEKPQKPPPRVILKSKQKNSSFFNSVIDTLSYILPQPGYFKTAVEMQAGFVLDVYYQLDSNNAPVLLQKADSRSTKVGILLLEYSETCSDNTPTGIFAFKTRVLERLGYKTVVLHHAEYPLSSTLSVKTAYIRQKISAVVDNDRLEMGRQKQDAK